MDIVACDEIYQSQGLIYIHDYNIPDVEKYNNERKKEYNLLDVKKATWMTTKNISSTPLLLTFKEIEPPRFIKILGEQAKTNVFDYFETPMSCKTCLKYEHTAKICHETTATCSRCSCQGHDRDKCTSNEVKSYHCGEDHQPFSRNCPVIKKKGNRPDPNKRAHTQATGHTKTSHTEPTSSINLPTRSKEHPNRTDQEAQSESSEDDSPTAPSYGHG